MCRAGDQNSACGAGGNACEACGTAESCEAGVCIARCAPGTCEGCCDGNICRDASASACGSGGLLCAVCTFGFDCGGDNTARYCAVPPDARFDLAIGDADLPSGSWDTTSDPDPFVRVVVAGRTGTTRTWSDVRTSETPTWSTEGAVLSDVSAADLLAGISITMFDEDVASNDVMFTCTHTPSETDMAFFSAGAYITCASGEIGLLIAPR